MVLTFLLHDPISAEIRTVDSQSDLTILSQLWLIKIWLHLTKEVEAPVDSFKQITVFCKSQLRVVTLFTKWESLYLREKELSWTTCVLPVDISAKAADIPGDTAWPVISTHINCPPLAVCWNDQISSNNKAMLYTQPDSVFAPGSSD